MVRVTSGCNDQIKILWFDAALLHSRVVFVWFVVLMMGKQLFWVIAWVVDPGGFAWYMDGSKWWLLG